MTPAEAAPVVTGGLAAVFLLGRVLFAAIFIMSGVNHFVKLGPYAQYVDSFKVPGPKVAVLVSGVMLLAGGLSILLGVAVRAGALLLVIFLVPVALIMHRFWGVKDPMMEQNQMAHFMKNLAMAGGALLIHYFSTLYPAAWVYSLNR